MIELSQVYCEAGVRVANCASTWRNHTSGLVVQKGGNLIETEDMVAGGVAAAGAAGAQGQQGEELEGPEQ